MPLSASNGMFLIRHSTFNFILLKRINTETMLPFVIWRKTSSERKTRIPSRDEGKDTLLKDYSKHEAGWSDGKIVAAVYDIQKVLTVPAADVSVFYYSRKLSAYNFSVFDLADRQGYCYVWDQSTAGKGPDEVCSSLQLFMSEKMATQEVEEFRFFSDNCAGQNRNRFLFGFYSYMSQMLKVNITHTFLEKRLTQNEGDSVHSVIEKEKKLHHIRSFLVVFVDP